MSYSVGEYSTLSSNRFEILMRLMTCRRASTLRSYAGDTSLPGGKWEPQDSDAEATAVRHIHSDNISINLMNH